MHTHTLLMLHMATNPPVLTMLRSLHLNSFPQLMLRGPSRINYACKLCQSNRRPPMVLACLNIWGWCALARLRVASGTRERSAREKSQSSQLQCFAGEAPHPGSPSNEVEAVGALEVNGSPAKTKDKAVGQTKHVCGRPEVQLSRLEDQGTTA